MAFTIAILTPLAYYQKLALLALGASPAGGNSNIYTFLLEGDIILSITMTGFSIIICLGM